MPRSSYYATQKLKQIVEPEPPPRALSKAEKEKVHRILNSERFQDQPPREVYATLLDEGIYLCHYGVAYGTQSEPKG